MKWLLGAFVLVGVVWLLVSGQEEVSLSEAPGATLGTPAAGPSNEAEHNSDLAGDQRELAEDHAISERANEEIINLDEGGVTNIGEPKDPDDPSTWPVDENTEVINIGEPKDPDDPSTWPVDENTEVINTGEPKDPDDPSTWPIGENTDVINIGEPMDPDDPSIWPVDENTEVTNVGEPMDPDDPSTWQRDGR